MTAACGGAPPRRGALQVAERGAPQAAPLPDAACGALPLSRPGAPGYTPGMGTHQQWKTADLWDEFGDPPRGDLNLRVMDPIFRDYGGVSAFAGPVATVKVHEDNVLVRTALSTAGEGRVLVVDGGGSLRYALVGDQLARLAIDNGWVGIVVAGCIRDAVEIGTMPIGVKALATNPRKSIKRGQGVTDETIEVAGVTVTPGDWLYADSDGVLVSPRKLHDA